MVGIMNKVLDIIKEFNIIKTDNKMIIKCNKFDLILPIKDGSVIINIIDENKEKIGLNDIFDELGKKYIKPIKIIKHFNYVLNNDSSDSDSD